MREVYLDNSATTRVAPAAAEKVLQMMLRDYGNPSSLHQKGLDAQLELEEAQRSIAALLGCDPQCIFFTSGGTESNNWAVFGSYAAQHRRGNGIITTSIEHSSILEPFHQLEKQGAQAVFLTPREDGRVHPDQLEAAITDQTVFVSVMLVNNEIGSIQPIQELVRTAKAKNPNIIFHCDAVQAFGKLPIQVEKLGVDLMSCSGHKIHAPKGVGALYIRKGVSIRPLLYGGAQQKGLRPGTENAPLACGMGVAARLCREKMDAACRSVIAAREHLMDRLAQMPAVKINSPESHVLPYIVNLSVPGYRSEILLHFLESRGIYVSSASACTKGAKSHVLAAMGMDPRRIDSSLRISLNRESTCEDMDALADALTEAIASLRHN